MALSPPWPGFDSRHGNSTSEIFRRTNSRILSKALEPTFQISVVDKFGSPPDHYNDYYLVFLFHFDNSLIYRPRHNTSVETLQFLFFGIIFRTIDSDTDPLLLKTDLKAVEEHSKNVNIKIERD